MAALGRILQVLGWLWVVAGIAGSFFDFGGFSVFPGLILLFVARAVRKQAARSEIPEIQHANHQPTVSQEEPATTERVLNTERQRETPSPTPEPAYEPVPEVEIEIEEPAARYEPPNDDGRELIERILGSGTDMLETGTPSDDDPVDRKPISSAEMLARAHDRWDSRKS